MPILLNKILVHDLNKLEYGLEMLDEIKSQVLYFMLLDLIEENEILSLLNDFKSDKIKDISFKAAIKNFFEPLFIDMELGTKTYDIAMIPDYKKNNMGFYIFNLKTKKYEKIKDGSPILKRIIDNLKSKQLVKENTIILSNEESFSYKYKKSNIDMEMYGYIKPVKQQYVFYLKENNLTKTKKNKRDIFRGRNCLTNTKINQYLDMISGLTGYKLTSESKFKFVYDDEEIIIKKSGKKLKIISSNYCDLLKYLLYFYRVLHKMEAGGKKHVRFRYEYIEFSVTQLETV